MPFDPLQLVDRAAFSADGCAFLGGGEDREHATGAELPPPPTFDALLGVSPRFLARHARSATEATLLMDVAGAAAALDVLLESLADQLSDRARVLDALAGACGRGGADVEASEALGVAHTTLLALQVQARDAIERNVSRLLKRFQTQLQTLLDLRLLLAQEVDKQRACLAVARNGNTDANAGVSSAVAAREELLRLEGALLERLNVLDRTTSLPPAFEPLARFEGDCGRENGDGGREICWPALSNPGSDESKRSEHNVGLNTTFGSLQSSSTTMSGASGNGVTLSE